MKINDNIEIFIYFNQKNKDKTRIYWIPTIVSEFAINNYMSTLLIYFWFYKTCYIEFRIIKTK
jgi:hypothetical protein